HRRAGIETGLACAQPETLGQGGEEHAMFDSLMQLFQAPAPQRQPDLRLSVAVLLVEAARQDDRFEPRERVVIEQLLTRKFGLAAGECAALLAAAEARAGE